ncbi:hypothetical protein UFOVP112_330 [uncultured Caudovirales phage]|uniref:Uncharacterized protein n=1 Tax=uncultured Caudovirales phage TaxID=2100421 RepID=A0A6J5L6U6_9CAUD|nr:hypothetical protein UFOVP112_330 [uncultured Caudovirales phage]
MSFLSNGVFVSNETDALFYYHFNKCNLLNSIQVYNDVDKFISSQHDKKIACLQMPYPLTNDFNILVNELAGKCDNILILVSELHDKTMRFIREHDRQDISYFICGDINITIYSSPIHKFYDWFTTSTHFYKHVNPDLLSELFPFQPKPKSFDILLGRKKLHRDTIYNFVNQAGLADKNVMTYINDVNCSFDDPAKWIWESQGLGDTSDATWTVNRVEYYGHKMSISQIVPISIYNQTCYSIVAETNWASEYSFYTEKTIKPILGRRLFVMFAGRDYLRNLRNIGFCTFDRVIDESYDNERGDMERFSMAMDQVKYLCSKPQEEILDIINPICNYNLEHLMRVDWYEEYFKSSFVQYFNQ